MSARGERPISAVPRPLLLLFACALGAQLWLANQRQPGPMAQNLTKWQLPQPPSEAVARGLALGDPATLSRALSLWLQNFDYRPGASLPLNRLDYPTVGRWLDLQLALDPRNQYPLLVALHLYGSVADKTRARWMLEWVASAFREDPARRWRYMAEAAIKAKHKLGDLRFARQLARELAERTQGIALPGWARQLHIFLTADLGERAEARALLGALIDSGTVQRAEELRFLRRKLDELDHELLKNRQQNDEISALIP